jgi:penicillin-binding protein 1A
LASRSTAAPALPVAGASIELDSLLCSVISVGIGYPPIPSVRRTLGDSTGGGVAVPIFEPVIQAVWANIASKTALAPPSPEAKHQLACKSIDLESGEVQRGGGITECFRVDAKGKIIDTQYR